jgi:3-oxocholest-4-en-26-oyl-CoA dehydrogenase beta subunit
VTFDPAAAHAITNGDVYSRSAFLTLGELGWAGLALPEDAGGDGGTLLDLCLVLEELGRSAAPTPLVASVALTARLLLAAGEGERRRELVASLGGGRAIGTFALLTPGPVDEWSSRPATGRRAGAGWELDARFTLVPFAHEADVVLVRAELDGHGDALVLLPSGRAGIRIERQRVIGGEPRAAVGLDGVVVGADDVLDIPPQVVAALVDHALDEAAVLAGAHTVGALEESLRLSVEYAKVREQFGRPIGAFQNISNRCADMRTVIDGARYLVWEAAWSLDEGKPYAAERVSVAKHYLHTAAELVMNNAHQVHGAIGYSTEYPLHVFTRSIKAFQSSYGTSPVHLERVARALGL